VYPRVLNSFLQRRTLDKFSLLFVASLTENASPAEAKRVTARTVSLQADALLFSNFIKITEHS
jgi:hypothetical protein